MRRGSSLLLAVGLAAATAAGPVLAQAPGGSGGDDAQRQRVLRLLSQLQRLEEEIRELRGEIQEQAHEIEGLKQRQRELYVDLDRRLREVELKLGGGEGGQPSQGGGQPADPSGDQASPGVADGQRPTPQAQASDDGGQPAQQGGSAQREAYGEAIDLLRDARYEEAIAAFKDFLEKYPDGSYADNAQYWLGEGYYVTRRFDEAEQEFKQVMDNYADSPKVPDAMLKLGYVYYEKQAWEQARQTLEQVRERFPDTTVARLAKRRLDRMKREGH